MRTKDENKRHAISQAAIELVYTNGLANTSMSKIAKKAGVSPSTIYVYFENKEDMLNKLYLYAKEQFFAALADDIDFTAPIKTLTRQYFDNFHRFTKKEPVVFLFSEQFANSPLVDKINKEKVDAMTAPLYDMVLRGIKEGIFRDVDPSIIVTTFISPSMMLYKQMHGMKMSMNEETIEILFDMTWKAVSA